MKNSSNNKKSVPKTLKAQIEELKVRKSALEHGMKIATVGFCYLDTNLRYIQINAWLAEINGLTVNEHIGRSIRELFPSLADGIEPQFRKVIETGNPIIKGRVCAETPSQPGVKRLFEHNYFADKSSDGVVHGISCFVEDITEREQAWDQLHTSENELRTFIDSVNAVPWRFDLKKNRFTFIGKQVEKLLGYPVSYWVDMDFWSSCIHAEDRDTAVKLCKDLTAKGLDHDLEYRCLTVDGNIVWLRDIVTLRKDETGVPIELIGYMVDITEQKQLENEVSQQHSRLEALVADRTSELRTRNLESQLEHQLLQYIVSAEDAEQALRMCLIELSEFLEYEHAEIWIPSEDSKYLKPFSHWTLPSKSSNPFSNRNDFPFYEKGQGLPGRVWKTRKMEWCSESKWLAELEDPCSKALHQAGIISALAVPVQTKDYILAVFCFYKTNSRKLSKSSMNLILATTTNAAVAIDRLHISTVLEHVLESAPGAMMLVTMDGTITYQNGVSSRLFGYSDSELLGKSIETLVPKEFHKSHSKLRANLNHKSLPRGMGSGLEIFGLKKNGTKIPIDVSLNMHKTLGRSQIIVGVIDLSEHQKNIDELSASRERLRDLTNHITSIAERERKSIARDLHDDLGQVLTSLKIDISIIERQVRAPENANNSESISEDLSAMSETLSQASERLHRFVSKLRPEILDNLGLITALEWQTEEFFKLHMIECEFICELDHLTVNDEIAIAIYRIVQECLTNISRHAKARNAKVKVDIIDNTLIVEVSDNGIGISNESLTSTNRFGLLGIRERASALNGSIQVESTLGDGTTVRATIPIKPLGTNSD